MDRLEQSHGVEVFWHAFLLRPPSSPPPSPERKRQIEASRPAFAERVRREYNVELNPGPFGVNTLPAHIVGKLALQQGREKEYQLAVRQAYWERGLAIDDPAVLTAIANESGLQFQNIDEVLQDQTLLAEVQQDLTEAYQNDFNGVPALVFNEKYLVSGAQPYDLLVKVVEKLESEEGEGDSPEVW